MPAMQNLYSQLLRSVMAMVIMPSLLTTTIVQTASAQSPVLAPNAPSDRPALQSSKQKFERAIAPYVAKAKAGYPGAKQRFLKGLPKGESFFLTILLNDTNGTEEQIFVAVKGIEGDQVSGRVWSKIMAVKGYRFGDPITFAESRMLDWLITKPDGTEEGNFVGKFLDTYSGH